MMTSWLASSSGHSCSIKASDASHGVPAPACSPAVQTTMGKVFSMTVTIIRPAVKLAVLLPSAIASKRTMSKSLSFKSNRVLASARRTR